MEHFTILSFKEGTIRYVRNDEAHFEGEVPESQIYRDVEFVC